MRIPHLTRRHLTTACLWGSVVFQLLGVAIDLTQQQWWPAGLRLGVVAAFLTAARLVDASDTWFTARLGKAEAERRLSELAVTQWERQVQAHQQEWRARQATTYAGRN